MPTETNRPARPLTDDQCEFVHGMWRYCEIHHVSEMSLARPPAALIRRGLVRVVAPACYALTPEGLAVAAEVEAVRVARAEVNRANRGSNAMIGAGQ